MLYFILLYFFVLMTPKEGFYLLLFFFFLYVWRTSLTCDLNIRLALCSTPCPATDMGGIPAFDCVIPLSIQNCTDNGKHRCRSVGKERGVFNEETILNNGHHSSFHKLRIIALNKHPRKYSLIWLPLSN